MADVSWPKFPVCLVTDGRCVLAEVSHVLGDRWRDRGVRPRCADDKPRTPRTLSAVTTHTGHTSVSTHLLKGPHLVHGRMGTSACVAGARVVDSTRAGRVKDWPRRERRAQRAQPGATQGTGARAWAPAARGSLGTHRPWQVEPTLCGPLTGSPRPAARAGPSERTHAQSAMR